MTAPIVLVPGLGLGPESYAPTCKHLQAQYEVVALPGYGMKAGRDDDLHIEALAERLVQQVKERSVLVGHSASCEIVVEATLQHPELVAALVLIAPSGDLTASSWPRMTGRWLRSALWSPPTLIPTLTKQYRRTGVTSITRAIEAARSYDLAAAASKLAAGSADGSRPTVPTVVIRSAHDKLAPALWTQQLADLTGGEAWTLPTGSHLPVLTNGRELAAFILRAAAVAGDG
ncbi:pimeloyl-ACP methyl ester carboxylesterase [Kribbella sp. VKM Ac-2527]|uniref:Pimeloyl-ACP methyl ester carboxylesterase n=1 Tax=Kribbella caucasensis TaxID=2512215 RepID=A0A4R6JDD2_9ACTN|nr:alpha/beta hydrolase [Kribbella sp. VKM Ac-2527]TDO33873.1 pimeloyl-ACP methyl ester carboxylesterase [Kribbella sp. VKM Ac-2527]